jgi:MFS family permease
MMSLLLLAPPLGVVTGYLISSFMIAIATWRWAFYIQSVISVAPTCLMILGIKSRYLDIEAAVKRRVENQIEPI